MATYMANMVANMDMGMGMDMGRGHGHDPPERFVPWQLHEACMAVT